MEEFFNFIEKIERLEQQKNELQSDIIEVYAQAKMAGLDVKDIQKVVELRKINKYLRESYKKVLGE